MSQSPADHDAALLASLGEVAWSADPPPDHVYALGRAAFTTRRLDAELADLVADSLLDAADVRAPLPAARLLAFQGGALTIEVQMSLHPGPRTLVGEVIPAPGDPGGTVRLETVGHPARVAALDVTGSFHFVAVTADLVRLVIGLPDGGRVATSWLNVATTDAPPDPGGVGP